jgi:hypothetical protein
MKLNLKDITLFCLDTKEITKAIDAIEVCNYYANFYDIKFVTNQKIDYRYVIYNKDLKISNRLDYTNFILNDLNNYIESKYVLIVQWDGFILNPKAWTDEFLQYDYIGAPWYHLNQKGIIGNGGFSLRSKFLLDLIPSCLNNKNIKKHQHEDTYICKNCRKYLEMCGIKFAPTELADKFSVETKGSWIDQFGFHGFENIEKQIYGINLERDGWKNPLKNYEKNNIS